VKIFHEGALSKYTLTICIETNIKNWHEVCKVVGMVGMVRRTNKVINMTQYARTQILSAFAAVICAFITIGISVAPAVAPAASLIA
jgi:hypothetical protein